MNYLTKMINNNPVLNNAVNTLTDKLVVLDSIIFDEFEWEYVKRIINDFTKNNKIEIECELTNPITDLDRHLSALILYKRIEPNLIKTLEMGFTHLRLSNKVPRLKNLIRFDFSQDMENPNKIILSAQLTYLLSIHNNDIFSYIIGILNTFKFNECKNLWITYQYNQPENKLKTFDLIKLYYTNPKVEKLLSELIHGVNSLVEQINLDLPANHLILHEHYFFKGNCFEDIFDLSTHLDSEIYTYLISLYNNYEGRLILEKLYSELFTNKFILNFLQLRIESCPETDKKYFVVEFKTEYKNLIQDFESDITFNELLKESGII